MSSRQRPLHLCLACVLLILHAAHAQDAPPQPLPANANWLTPKRYTQLAPHPRLFVSRQQLQRAIDGRGEDYDAIVEQVVAAADSGLRDLENPMAEVATLPRSMYIQGRLTAMAIQWHRTRDRRYLEGAVATIEAMRDWLPYTAELGLQEGQYIAAIAITYDLLYHDLTPAERRRLVDIARDHCIRPFLRLTGRGHSLQEHGERGSWWQHIVSNWNAVCNAGPGMLALTMYEELDEAQIVIDRVDASFQPIIDDLQVTEGGWVEGLGYWNWTIHYLSLYYISFERSTGLEHAGFRSTGFHQTMTFGQYFVANGIACGFGDNQHGGLGSSILAAAEHLGYTETLKLLQDYKARQKARARPNANTRPPEAIVNLGYWVPQDLLILPDPLADVASAPTVTGISHSYPKQGWAMLADKWPEPTIYAAVRGGELGGPHTHDDLLSWNAVIGAEHMICTINKAGYYDTAWQSRAWEIYERNAASENTLFIGGLSAYSGSRRGEPASAKTTHYRLPVGPAVRLDATRALWLTRRSPRLVCRLFVVIDDQGLLVLDRIQGRGANPVEARAHTAQTAEFGETDVLLTAKTETVRMSFAADQPAKLRRAVAMLTDARAEPQTVIRWQTLGSVRDVTLAALLTRGKAPVDLQVSSGDGRVTVSIRHPDWQRELVFDDTLQPVEAEADPTVD